VSVGKDTSGKFLRSLLLSTLSAGEPLYQVVDKGAKATYQKSTCDRHIKVDVATAEHFVEEKER
jgi:hypothetical protein